MHIHSGCRYMQLAPEFTLRDLAAFHGHLGPYIVLGYRIGCYVRRNFCDDPFDMQAIVHCSGIPPESCIADGIQLGSGCTLGKRNIVVVRNKRIWCVFEANGKRITVTPKPFRSLPQDDDYELCIERYAEELYAMNDDELFDAKIQEAV